MPTYPPMDDLAQIIADAQNAFAHAIDTASLENEKARFLGKTSLITERLKMLSKLDIAQRKVEGASINFAKQQIEQALRARRQVLADALMNRRLITEAVDVTLPGRSVSRGGLHPVMITWERVEQIFSSIGFDIADGPEIETDWINFTALNSPENHPARSMQDTFYIDAPKANNDPLVLRTHTSAMQIRYAQTHRPPIKVIAPGRVYRVDSDATHSPMFNQVEGLWIDENISFADLKGVYTDFLSKFFERDHLQVRFRPSYFPFTEPSAEIDMKFEQNKQNKQNGHNHNHNHNSQSAPVPVYADRWLEISGAGQVHPTVIRNMGLDPARYIGFAFGSGLERLTMLRYGIQDLRCFFEGDIRFLKQFS